MKKMKKNEKLGRGRWKSIEKMAIISILLDSYAHNIGAHALPAIQRWLNNRISKQVIAIILVCIFYLFYCSMNLDNCLSAASLSLFFIFACFIASLSMFIVVSYCFLFIG